jgi:hypothetical protein
MAWGLPTKFILYRCACRVASGIFHPQEKTSEKSSGVRVVVVRVLFRFALLLIAWQNRGMNEPYTLNLESQRISDPQILQALAAFLRCPDPSPEVVRALAAAVERMDSSRPSVRSTHSPYTTRGDFVVMLWAGALVGLALGMIMGRWLWPHVSAPPRPLMHARSV